MKKTAGLFLAILFLAACVQGPRPWSGAAEPPAEGSAGPGETAAGSALEGPAFTGLPPEAKSYLELLSGAFRRQDGDFLLAQGETQFERELRPRFDEASYLALLYRCGAYAEEGPIRRPGTPRLFPGEIRRIEYLGWEERGPLLEIRGRLVTQGGDAVPCVIMLIWRLREPKIQGLYP
ncbi:MAG: hypothetical protein LBL43_00420 [Treponema sp.]|jgi:hypothetical protein|nr:hypothetical protein [Treponema sp.]